MLNKMSALWLVIGAVGGYAVAGPSATAQNAPDGSRPPFLSSGDEATLQLDIVTTTHYVRCAVAEIQGTWIRCGPTDKFSSNPRQSWYSLQRVIEIEKRVK